MDTTYIILLAVGLLLLIGVIVYETVAAPAAPTGTGTGTGTGTTGTVPDANTVPVSNIAGVAGNALVSSGTATDTVYQASGLKSGGVISAANGYTLTNSATGVLNLTDSKGTLLYTVGTADNVARTLTVSPSGQAVFGDTIALNTGASAADSYYLKLGADGTLAVWKTGATAPMATIFVPSTTPLNNYQLASSALSFGPPGGDSLFQNGSLAPGGVLNSAGGNGVQLVNNAGGDLVLVNGTYGNPWCWKATGDPGDKTYTVTKYGELLRTSTTPGIYPTPLNPRMAEGKYFLQVANTVANNVPVPTLKMLPFDVPPTSSNTYVFLAPVSGGNALLQGSTLASGSSISSPTAGFYRLYNNPTGALELYVGGSSTPVWGVNLVNGAMAVSVNATGQIVMTGATVERLNRASSDPGSYSLVVTDDGVVKVVNNTTNSTFFQLYPEPSSNSVLGPGQVLMTGQMLANNGWTFENQSDGNVVLYAKDHVAKWSTGTNDGKARKVFMAATGQMMIRGNGVQDKVYGPSYSARDYMLELTPYGHLQTIDQQGNVVYTIWAP